MMRSRPAVLVSLLAVAAALAMWTRAESDEGPWTEAAVRARFPDPDRAAPADAYADNSDCTDCHLPRLESMKTSSHRTVVSSKKVGPHGCQECHGPGEAHVDDEIAVLMRNPLDTVDLSPQPQKPPKEGEEPRRHVPVTVREMNGTCVKCHADVLVKPLLGHREWLGRTRDPSGERSCVSCHSIHVDGSLPQFDEKIGPFATAKDLAAKSEPAPTSLCISCHTEFHPQMAKSGHAFLLADGPEHGCAACHGNGRLHAQSGGDRKKIILPTNQRAADTNAACNACHNGSNATAKWTCSEHSRQGLSCIECHDPNAAKGHTLRDPGVNLVSASPTPAPKSPELALCGKCHVDVAIQFNLRNRHRVAEGRMSCSDCHDPHGNTDKVRDRDVALLACVKCHQDKAGPFLYDHGIKRSEGCIACHDPHGSTNRRMLTHASIQPLCMQCHPETPHDIRRPKFKNCISCHTEIHGSHLDRNFTR